jgi:hypothetical protein
MSDNKYLVKRTQTSVDAITLFDRPYELNTKFIFNDSIKNKLFRLGKQPNRGLTLSLLEFDSAIDSEAADCLNHITACLWRTQNNKNIVSFKNSSNEYFDVTFKTIGELLLLQGQITHTFDASFIVLN